MLEPVRPWYMRTVRGISLCVDLQYFTSLLEELGVSFLQAKHPSHERPELVLLM